MMMSVRRLSLFMAVLVGLFSLGDVCDGQFVGNSTMPDTSRDTCQTLFGQDRCDTVFAIRITTAVLSCAGNVFIVAFILLHRTYRNFNQRLVLWLTVAELMDTIPYFLGKDHLEADAMCITQGFLMTWFDWSSLLWTLALTHAMAMALLYEKTAETYEPWYHGICWMVGLVCSLVPLASNAFGPSTVWCWITKEYPEQRWGLWYGPLFFSIFSLILINIYIFYTINQRNKQWQGTYTPEIEKNKQFLKAQVKPLKWYPIIALFCYAFPLANRIDDVVPGQKPYALLVLHALFTTIKGFFNACCYFALTDKKVWQQCTFNGIKRALQQRGGTSVAEYSMHDGASISNDIDDSDDDDDDGPRSDGNRSDGIQSYA